MTRLESVGAIAPGTSIPTVAGLLAARLNLHVSDALFDAWKAALRLATQVDNRVDGDFPESGKPLLSEDETVVLAGLQPYLERVTSANSAEFSSAFLSAEQARSFTDLVTCFSALNTGLEARTQFCNHLSAWISASFRAKSSRTVAAFIDARTDEGIYLGRMYTCITPLDWDDLQRAKFDYAVEALSAASMIFDAAVDYSRDRSRGEVCVVGQFIRVRLVLRSAGLAGRTILGNRTLIRPIARKIPNYVRNRKGTYNSIRDAW